MNTRLSLAVLLGAFAAGPVLSADRTDVAAVSIRDAQARAGELLRAEVTPPLPAIYVYGETLTIDQRIDSAQRQAANLLMGKSPSTLATAGAGTARPESRGPALSARREPGDDAQSQAQRIVGSTPAGTVRHAR